jgi:hypothetical protein
MTANVAVIVGMAMAVFFGMLQDVFCQDIPRNFSGHQPDNGCFFSGACDGAWPPTQTLSRCGVRWADRARRMQAVQGRQGQTGFVLSPQEVARSQVITGHAQGIGGLLKLQHVTRV